MSEKSYFDRLLNEYRRTGRTEFDTLEFYAPDSEILILEKSGLVEVKHNVSETVILTAKAIRLA